MADGDLLTDNDLTRPMGQLEDLEPDWCRHGPNLVLSIQRVLRLILTVFIDLVQRPCVQYSTNKHTQANLHSFNR